MLMPAAIDKTETSSLHLSSEGLSVHMRIPAEWLYLSNAVLTLKEICEHLDLPLPHANRIVLVLEEALMNAIEHAYQDDGGGLVDLQFTVQGTEFLVAVEDFGCGIPADLPEDLLTEDEILSDRGRGLMLVRGIADKALVQTTSQGGTRATMLFYLPETNE